MRVPYQYLKHFKSNNSGIGGKINDLSCIAHRIPWRSFKNFLRAKLASLFVMVTPVPSSKSASLNFPRQKVT